MIKNQEIINGNLTGYFSNNKKLNFTVQSKDNQKITTLYLFSAKIYSQHFLVFVFSVRRKVLGV